MNPVTDQVTAMLSTGATRPCSNQRACDAAGQVSTAPAGNVGTGRLRTNRQQGHAALDLETREPFATQSAGGGAGHSVSGFPSPLFGSVSSTFASLVPPEYEMATRACFGC